MIVALKVVCGAVDKGAARCEVYFVAKVYRGSG
jgi:hypothetical protein